MRAALRSSRLRASAIMPCYCAGVVLYVTYGDFGRASRRRAHTRRTAHFKNFLHLSLEPPRQRLRVLCVPGILRDAGPQDLAQRRSERAKPLFL